VKYFSKSHRAAISQSCKQPKESKRRSALMKSLWQTGAITSERTASWRIQASLRMKRRWQDNAYRKSMLRQIKLLGTSSSNRMLKSWADDKSTMLHIIFRNRSVVSKPQKFCFRWVKRFFPEAELEYSITIKDSLREKTFGFHLDIAIPREQIDIEVDGGICCS